MDEESCGMASFPSPPHACVTPMLIRRHQPPQTSQHTHTHPPKLPCSLLVALSDKPSAECGWCQPVLGDITAQRRLILLTQDEEDTPSCPRHPEHLISAAHDQDG